MRARFLEETAVVAVLLLFVEGRHLELAVGVGGRAVRVVEFVALDPNVELRRLLQLLQALTLRILLPIRLHGVPNNLLDPCSARQRTYQNN